MSDAQVGRMEFAPMSPSPAQPCGLMSALGGGTVSLRSGCQGERHEFRPWFGAERPVILSCYCGAKRWVVEACPTCGHDRTVSA